MESVTYREILEEGYEKGVKEGIEKGMEKGMEKGVEKGKIDDILSILSARFGKVPENLARRIEKVKDIKRLDQLLLEAVKVSEMEEFERTL